MRDKQGMWVHHCPSDQGWYGIGPDEECIWCGRTEEDEPPHFLTAPGASNMVAAIRRGCEQMLTELA